MTKEEFRDKKSKDYRKHREDYGIKDPIYLDEIEKAYYQGMVDADNNPYWINVKDELPPKKDGNLYLSVNVLATNGDGVYTCFYDYHSKRWIRTYNFTIDNFTHWMPRPSIEYLKKEK